MAVQRLVLPLRHDLHWRHSGVYKGMTWSPGLTLVTPGPTSRTTPAPSCPRIAGKSPSGPAPDSVTQLRLTRPLRALAALPGCFVPIPIPVPNGTQGAIVYDQGDSCGARGLRQFVGQDRSIVEGTNIQGPGPVRILAPGDVIGS